MEKRLFGNAGFQITRHWVRRMDYRRSPQPIPGATVGARLPGQVDGFIGAAEFRLTPDEIEEIG